MHATQQSKGSLRATITATAGPQKQQAPLRWRLSNWLTRPFIFGLAANATAKTFSRLTGIPTMTSTLHLVHVRADGIKVDHGIVSRRVITTAWVNFIVDQLQTETSEFGDLKYHDSGVGTTAAAVGDTDIETTDGESRVAGTQTENAANIYESVGTISYTTSKAITEHILATQSTGGTVIDRHVFAAINVVNGNAIQFTYRYTLNS
jgi:hypothetical protein